MCFMTHRPLKKVKRSAGVLLLGVALFLLICFAFYWGMWDGHNKLLSWLHHSLYLASEILIFLILPAYLLAVFMEPGKLKKQFDFIWLVDQLLERGLHLDNLCVYD